ARHGSIKATPVLRGERFDQSLRVLPGQDLRLDRDSDLVGVSEVPHGTDRVAPRDATARSGDHPHGAAGPEDVSWLNASSTACSTVPERTSSTAAARSLLNMRSSSSCGTAVRTLR